MKKALILITGLFVSAAINVWAAISIDSISVTGTNSASGAVTVGATIRGASAQGAMAYYQVTSTNGLTRRYFPPALVSGTSWSDTSWTPYFTGTFSIDISAFDNDHQSSPVTASTTVTVTRVISGTVNAIKYSTAPYNATGVWNDVDTSAVKLHDIGLNLDVGGVGSIGCNLLNADPGDTSQMGEEARDIAYTDTVGYKPAGTPYRFFVSLHARPRGFMGMGEIKRWIWHPSDTNAPDGAGWLEVDLTSCSPWRSSYSNALQSHVGFAPLFAPSAAGVLAGASDMPTGMIMCTSAHYMDVGPTNTGSQTDARVGLRVNGHTDTNSYLKMFLSDTFLQQQLALTNVLDATNLLAGFVQHFNTNGAPLDDVTQVTASFARIAGGTNNIVYDYNYDGIGDSGYEMSLNFEFHSAVAAQMGVKSTNVTVSAYTALAADFDGDAKADPAVYNTNGNWKIKLSIANYTLIPLIAFLGGSGYVALAADFDGDRRADPAIYSAALELWAVKLSSLDYLAPTIIQNFGGSGWAALAEDFDGDRKADPALYQASTGTWKIMLSGANYLTITKSDFMGATGWAAIAADFDGDGKVDPTIYQASTGSWIVMLSRAGYILAVLETGFLGSTGYTGIGADFDGDGLADPAVAQTSTGNWEIRLSNAGYIKIPLTGFLGE